GILEEKSEDNNIIGEGKYCEGFKFCYFLLQYCFELRNRIGSTVKSDSIVIHQWINTQNQPKKQLFQLIVRNSGQREFVCFLIAKLEVAFSLIHGIGIQRNPSLGFKLFEIAAISGDPKAQLSLANCYMAGIGTPKDKIKGLNLYQKSAENNNAEAHALLGFCFLIGDGVKINMSKAFAHFTKSAELGSPVGLFCLGECFEKGHGVNKDEEKAFICFQGAAKSGKGIDIDYSKAYCWFQKAAQRQNSYAFTLLGNAHEFGRGVRKNMRNAFILYLKAANGDDYMGQRNITENFLYGMGTSVDVHKSIYWIRQGLKHSEKTTEENYEDITEILQEIFRL
ncbi:8843_t:CDS:2, partial [Ambispora gerdemannii]